MEKAASTSLKVWLWIVCAMILAMVTVGGVTRLTGSGLSIVDWKPIMGAIPPLSHDAWMEAFSRYQESPQYKLVNHGMNLSEFKFIFFWEYIHRLLGRMIGLVFFVPFTWFLIRKRIDRRLAGQLGLAFLLGGLQGFLGWFMVKSGLVNEPRVSHFRLAAHLSLAVGLLGYLFWILMSLEKRTAPSAVSGEGERSFILPTRLLTLLIALQIVYGAFTAGLRAGFSHNTFPLMNGSFIPDGFGLLAPAWMNLLANPVAVQFVHRCVAWLLVLSIFGLWWRSRAARVSPRTRRGFDLLAGMVVVQFLLGVLTLLWVVPISLATLHQLGACILLLIALKLNYQLSSDSS